jgi:hypothetical protein
LGKLDMKRIYNQGETIAANRRIPFVCTGAAERQLIALNDIGAGDSFTLTWEGQTTAAINQSSDMSSAIDTALENLSNIEAGDITVTKVSGVQSYYVDFGGSLVGSGIALMTITPTGFTPTGISRVWFADGPATSLTFAAADIQISKNGAANANSSGTVTEVGNGLYYYNATQAELDTRGPLILSIVRSDLAGQFMSVEVGGEVIRSFTAQTGTASTITLDAGASSTSDFYLPCYCVIRKGTGVGQGPRFVSAYNGQTGVATVSPDWVTLPDSTTEAELILAPPLASLTEMAEAARDQIIGGDASPLEVSDGRVRLAKVRATP